MQTLGKSARTVAAFSAIVVASLSGPVAADDTSIGVLFLDSHSFFAEIQKGIIAGGEEEGLTLIANNSEGDPAREAEFLDTVIGAGVKAIVMSPVSTEASVPAVERAVDAGIPVVCYNTCLSDADTDRLAGGLVTTNQFDFGQGLGEVAAAHISTSGQPARVGILNCDRYEACQQRKAGFVAALDAAGADYRIVADQEGYIADDATQTATEMLTANPDINLMWTANEGGTIGAVLGAEAAGLAGETVVFGSDISMQIAQMLQDGTILRAVIAQQPREMGRQSVKIALALINGQPVEEKLIYTPTLVIPADEPETITNWIAAQ